MGEHQTPAEIIREALGKKRGAQADLARRTGVSRCHVSGVIKGRHLPADLPTWADALGMRGADRSRFFRAVVAHRQAPEVRLAILGEPQAPGMVVRRDLVAIRADVERLLSAGSGLLRVVDSLIDGLPS